MSYFGVVSDPATLVKNVAAAFPTAAVDEGRNLMDKFSQKEQKAWSFSVKDA